jgi:hypothetical protein
MGPKDRLNIYLENVSDIPFEWGVHDCFTFTNNAFRAMYGRGYADDWMGLYMQNGTPLRRDELRKVFRASTIDAGLSKKLVKSDTAPHGCLVTTKKYHRWWTGVALGISLGSRCVFLGKEGLVKLDVEDIESAWVLG